MTAGSRVIETADGSEYEGENGIVYGHAYTLLDVREEQKNGQDQVLFKLRNPWGNTEWNGAWSDHSSDWKQSKHGQVPHKQKDDGIFYIGEDDFFENFDVVSVCYARKNAQTTKSKVQHSKGGFDLIEVEVTEPVDYLYFMISQAEAELEKRGATFDISPMRIMVAKKGRGGQYEYIEGSFDTDIQTWVKLDRPEQGTYVAFVSFNWHNDKVKSTAHFRTYSNKKVSH